MWKEKLFNPFLRIAGFTSLWIGLLILILASGLGMFSRCHFDGALDVHIGAQTPLWFYFAESLIAWILLFLSLYIAGSLSSKSKIRLIDVAGTTVLARWPMIFVALIALGVKDLPRNITDVGAPLIIFGLASIAFSVWMIALLYNAYSVSCNVKGSRGTISFITALIIAEVLSKLIIIKLYTVL